MVNVLGHRSGSSSAASLPAALSVDGASVHVYGKHEVRPGRKMGHVTVLADTLDDARERAYRSARLLEL
jgi:5-(carboxyamino)imidazole ribonucleotide synthase